MAPPITWQNVTAPDLTDSARILEMGSNNLGAAIDSFKKAFDPIKQARDANQQAQIDFNTNNELARLGKIQDLNQLRSEVANLDPLALAKAHGGMIDTSKVLNASKAMEGNLMDVLNKRYTYDQNQIDRKDQLIKNPLMEEAYSYTNLADLEKALPSLMQRAQTMENGGSTVKELAGLVDSLRTANLNKDEAALRMAGLKRANTTAQQEADKLKNNKFVDTALMDFYSKGNDPKDVEAFVDAMVIDGKPLDGETKQYALTQAKNLALENSPLISTTEANAVNEKFRAAQASNDTQKEIEMRKLDNTRNFIKEQESTFGLDKGITGETVDGDPTKIMSVVTKFSDKLTQNDIETMSKDVQEGITKGKLSIIKDYVKEEATTAPTVAAPKGGVINQGVKKKVRVFAENRIKEDFGLTDAQASELFNPKKGKEQIQKDVETFLANNIVITDDVVYKAGKGNFESDLPLPFNYANVNINDGSAVKQAWLEKRDLIRRKAELQKAESEINSNYNNKTNEAAKQKQNDLMQSLKTAGR